MGMDRNGSPDEVAEQALRDSLSIDAPWALIERFTTLVRESGSDDERTAALYIAEQLGSFGVPVTMHEPTLLLSIPRSASVVAGGRTLRAKTPSFSRSTGPEGLAGEVVYVPPDRGGGLDDIFDATGNAEIDVRGKIVLAEGYGGPGAAYDFEQRGAIGQIHINPGIDIHWGTCTTIWGAPDLDSYERKPSTVIVSINRPDGEWLRDLAQAGGLTVTLHAELTEGWMPCLLPVAEIPGTEEPEKFVLVHGHYDSWDVGIGDNAVGDATLLELARVFWQHRDKLKRSVRIAWWPGHSTGRYAGSTWYADAFGNDLDENCIAQVDIDSPGCRWATEYYDISCMTEAVGLTQRAIKDATGKDAQMGRPHQAGDYSFNNIGISSFFMLLSSMPQELIAEKGYYPVGGCGSNIAWHTENDTIEIADKDNLLRDLHVYVTSISRVVNAPIYPFDFRALADEFLETLRRYSAAAAGRFDFEPAVAEVRALRADLDALYAHADTLQGAPAGSADARAVNAAILELARVLVPINYTRGGRFRTEPALGIPPLPDLAPAAELGAAEPGSERAHIIATHLMRGRNRLVAALREARRIVARAKVPEHTIYSGEQKG